METNQPLDEKQMKFQARVEAIRAVFQPSASTKSVYAGDIPEITKIMLGIADDVYKWLTKDLSR